MGRRSKGNGKSNAARKRARRKALDMTQQALNQSEGALPTEIPDEFSNCIIQPMNSLLRLRGDEPKLLLKNGQLLIKCDKVAVLPLEEYDQLLQAYQMMQKAADGIQRQQLMQQNVAAVAKKLGIDPSKLREGKIVAPTAAQVAQADKLKA